MYCKLNKYRQKLSMSGGAVPEELTKEPFTEATKIRSDGKPEPNFKGWTLIKIKEFYIYENLIEESEKPNLFVMSGFSIDSVCECAPIIIDKLDVLRTKYRAVYIINLTPFKKLQGDACKIRDELVDHTLETFAKGSPEYLAYVKSVQNRETRNAAEIALNNQIGGIIHSLITTLKLSNVHLLGKCAGGGVAISMVNISPIYTGLFLAVPSSPPDVRHLSPPVLRNVKFRFSWNLMDVYVFDWHKQEAEGRVSADEKVMYDNTMRVFQKENPSFIIDYVSFMLPTDPVTAASTHRYPEHEINRKFIDYICLF
jgi:hypothetical protein